ncbi:MAG: alpha/beta fold hydrolase [Chloroflexi bacterium]|nr:alpha/beta fold hydrolase [Chloroflexota bacterium]
MSNLRVLTSEEGPSRPEWLRSELFPFTSRFVQVDDARVHYVDDGKGPTLLFPNGAPNWSFSIAPSSAVCPTSSAASRWISRTLGLSPADPRYPATMPALAGLVEQFIQVLDLRDIILVVGDAGGPIGLGVAARHPDWFAGLVLAGTFGWSLKDYPKVRRMLGIVSSAPFAFVQEHTNFLMKYTAGTFNMSAEERKAFLAPYVDATARRNPGVLLGDLAFNEGYMNDIEHALRTNLNDLPALSIWGDKDPVFEFLARFQEINPHARTLVLPDAHHFPFAEAPNEMIAAIRSWWADASSTTSERKVS